MSYLNRRNALGGLLIAVFCAWLVSPASPAGAAATSDIQDFGVSDIQVKSVQTLAVADFMRVLLPAARTTAANAGKGSVITAS